jgi:predicted alpha/beta-fold hydrolase
MADFGKVRAEYRYRPAWWLPGPHAQTLWGRFARRIPRIRTAREIFRAPDGDRLEMHSLPSGATGAPHVLLLHGLEGSVKSHYVGGILSQAARRGWGASVLIFRGCGDEPNNARRFYHSGETSDLEFVFSTLGERWPSTKWFLCGVSLGGNVLLKWLGEQAGSLDRRIMAAAAISVPFDLEAGARKISQGLARIYDRNFLRTLRHKALAKLDRYPDLFDRARLVRARSVFDFDDAVTGPVHGFESAHDYYSRSSSLAYLPSIRVPTLLLSAADDPFLPTEVLTRVAVVASENRSLDVEFHSRGGHVGFVGGSRPWRPFYYAEWRVFEFFDVAMERESRSGYD